MDGVYLAPGDLLAVSVFDNSGQGWFLASFHGDSNGLSTQPVLSAIIDLVRSRFGGHTLLLGLDANTHSASPDSYHHSVDDFIAFTHDLGLTSLWGNDPDPEIRTSCSCRTYLQTQTAKATPMSKRSLLKNQNLKDWIMIFKHQVINP